MPDTPRPAARGMELSAFVRRGLLNQLVCLAVGVGFWAASSRSHGFWVSNLYAFVIGNLIWLIIDGGCRLIVRVIGSARDSWPGWATMGPLAAIGAVGGYSIGSTIVDALLGLQSPGLFAGRGSGIVTLFVAGAVTYLHYTRERLYAERAAAEQTRRLALESQLKLLESQLEPHMLFNTLANLRVLIGVDPARAQAMLDRLIAFLRAMLGGARAQRQPLQAEFDRLADYLALMAVRMGDRLAVRFELPAALRQQPVPSLLLQPLVENAIKHGLEPKVEGGRIEVCAAQAGGMLRLTVRDSGVGLDRMVGGSAAPGTGLGTSNVRERLAALYGDAARLELQRLAEGGTLATVTLPLTGTDPGNAGYPCCLEAAKEPACPPPSTAPAR